MTDLDEMKEESEWRKAVIADLKNLQNNHWHFARNITYTLWVVEALIAFCLWRLLK